MAQSCLKHSTKWVNEIEWVSKVKAILWPWSKVTQISKLKLVFRRNSWAFGTKIHMKAWRRIGMKIYTNELGHMTNMAAMPINGKNHKKSSSPEPIDQLWTWYVALPMQVLPKLFKLSPWVDLDSFYAKVKFGLIGFCMGKSENYYFLGGHYCSLRSQSCLKHSTKWVNEVEWGSKNKVILWPWSKVTQTSKLKLVFHRNSWAIRNQSSYESWRENGNENLYKWVRSHDQHGCHAHIW